MLKPSQTKLGLCGLATLIVAVGCSAGADDATGGSGGNGSGASASTFGDGAGTATFGDGGGGNGVGGGCVGTGKTADKVPLDMYIMLDKSSSMSGSKWNAVAQALQTFIGQPEAAGIGVGIQYFPLPSGVTCPSLPVMCSSDAQCQTGCGPCILAGPFGFCSGVGTADSCEVMDYSTPAVEIAALPGNQPALSGSISGESPDGSGTPTSPALEGAIAHASDWATANPGHVTIVVLATDGDPTSCSSDIPAIQALAAAGAAATPPVLTFVIGVGGSQANLNGIASSGGTGSAFMIDQSPNVQDAFLMAMNEIQNQSLPCSYLIPEPPAGEEIDFGAVNVSYTPSGGQPQTIPQASGPGSCMPGSLAWYYDNPSNPTQIVLCPDTCAMLAADDGTTVDVVFGCATIVQ